MKQPIKFEDTQISTWFERDRACVDLQDANGVTIAEWWDADVSDLVEDGFLNPRDWHRSAFEYAQHLGLIESEADRIQRENEARVSSPAYRKTERRVLRDQRNIRKAVR